MDRLNAFVQVWHTSSVSKDDSNGVSESHVTTSSDLTFSFDFPIPRDSYVNTSLATMRSSVRKRESTSVPIFDTNFQPAYQYYDLSNKPATTEVKRAITNDTSWTSAKISEAWEEFSNVSTFHGMRFVCAKNYHHFRRVVWILLLTCCLAALGLQVYKQVLYFYSNPKTISVEKKNMDFVEFPALTICNENTFKITAAVKAGLYEVVTQMMKSKLTVEYLVQNSKENITLDYLNYKLGNRVENMLLRCKWGEETCGVNNFTTLITDRGLCFTFNSPEAVRELKVLAPGNSKGLQLTLNVEEYERMPGPNVASGVHILVHTKRTYPLVEQFGQAVAAGSHTFVALNIQKEQRLGPPHDACKTGQLTYVPNVTYIYDLPSCQIDCFVKFVVERCGCKDYYMPGNDTVCTLRQYVDCLKPAQKDYLSTAESYCKCTTPCSSEAVETEFSYAALSESAILKINEKDLDDIKTRYMHALDVYEYKSNRTSFKDNYKLFNQNLRTVSNLYTSVRNMLSDVRKYIQRSKEFVFDLYAIKEKTVVAQTCVFQEGFVEAKNKMEETTLGEIADDLYIFSYEIIEGVKSIGTTSNKNLREVQYMLLREQLVKRIWLAGLALDNLTQLINACKSGQPVYNITVQCNQEILGSKDFISPELLNKAITFDNVKVDRYKEVPACSAIRTAVSYLEALLNVTDTVYNEGNLTEEQAEALQKNTAGFKQFSMDYLLYRDTFYNEVIKWPLGVLANTTENLKEAKQKCGVFFIDIVYKIGRLLDLTSTNVLSTFTLVDELLQTYLDTWNVTKFDIANLVFNNVSTLAISHLKDILLKIDNYADGVEGLWSNLDTCMAEIVMDIEDEALRKVIKYQTELQFFGVFKEVRELTNFTERIRANFSSIRPLLLGLEELQRLYDNIASDMKTFRDSSAIDSSFYSKNFIFLDVFFTDISYTFTEHNVACTVYSLLSNIGGSMGLMVGASAISLCEFLDLFCVVAAHLCRGNQKLRQRLPSNSQLTSVYCQR